MADAIAVLDLFALVAIVFVAEVLAFALVRRIARGARRCVAHGTGALAALAFFIGLQALTGSDLALMIPGWAMVICNAYVLFHLDNMAETARRVRILRELCEAPGGLERKSILAAYSPREVFERRIERLKLAGQLREEGGHLQLSGDSYSTIERLVNLCARIVFG